MADEDKNTTLMFIERYRSYPELWDQSNRLYRNKIKRTAALQVLATTFNMDVDGVKKKIKSLRSYFSKEHQKVVSAAGTDETYLSPWFAYNHLLFIADADSVTPRATKETRSEEVQDWQVEITKEERSATSHSTDISEDEHEFILPPKKKKRIIQTTKLDDKEEEAYSFMKKASEELAHKDECSVYGQLVAHKIRKLNSYNRLIAQQRINNVLFELEMGQMSKATGSETPNNPEDPDMSNN